LGKKSQPVTVPLISIVDDDSSLVDAIVSLLQSIGYEAEGFLSPAEFLQSPRLLDADCLILDVRMPAIGGLELQQRLAAMNHQIPIIFVTSYDSDEVRNQAFQAGAVGFLSKPFSQESLFKAVRGALAIRRNDRS
jgi:FixJ family two-component response regulator